LKKVTANKSHTFLQSALAGVFMLSCYTSTRCMLGTH